MNLLHIALQEGFRDDTVVIQLNGKEVAHKKNVTTRTQIGLAETFEFNISEGTIEVEVLIPLRNLSEKNTFRLSKPLYLGVSIENGKISYQTSEVPFGYL